MKNPAIKQKRDKVIVLLCLLLIFSILVLPVFSAEQGAVSGDRQICYEGKTILLFDELPQSPSVITEGIFYGRIDNHPELDPRFDSASLSPDKKVLVFIVEFSDNRNQWWGTKDLVSGKVKEGGFRWGGGLEPPVISPQGDKVIFEDSGGSGSGMHSIVGYYLDTFKPLKINELASELFGQKIESFDPRWKSNETIEYKTTNLDSINKSFRMVSAISSWIFDLNTGKTTLTNFYLQKAPEGGVLLTPYTEAKGTSKNIRWIIIHTTDGSAESAIKTFQSPDSHVSVHFVIDQDGKVSQLLEIKDVAYHAGNRAYNYRSIGIALEQNGSQKITEAQYKALAKLTRWIGDNWGVSLSRPKGIAPANPDDGSGIIGHDQVPDPDNPN